MHAAAWYRPVALGRPQRPAAERPDEPGHDRVAVHGEIGAAAQTGGTDHGFGKGDERVQRGDTIVARQDFEAEGPRAVRDDGGRYGTHGGGHTGDGPVGNREEEQVHTRGGREDLVRTPEKPFDLNADLCEAPEKDRPARPAPMMRTVVIVSSLRSSPVHQVPFVSQLREPTNASYVDRCRVRLGEPCPPPRWHARRVEVLERCEHEAPLVHPRVRHHEIGLADAQVPEEEDVDVQGAWPVADGADPSRLLLEPMRDPEELPGLRVVSRRTTQLRNLFWPSGPPIGAVSYTGETRQAGSMSRSCPTASSRWPMRSPMFEPRPRKTSCSCGRRPARRRRRTPAEPGRLRRGAGACAPTP